MTFLTAVLFLVLSVGIAHGAPEAVCSDPNVFFCDNFEDRDLGGGDFSTNKGGKTLGWGVSETTTQTIINTGCQDGGKCLQQTYPDLSTPQNKDNGGGGFIGTPNLGLNRTMYYRLWLKYPTNWVESPNGSKIVYMENGSGVPREELMSQRPGPASTGTWPVLENVSNIMRGIPNMNLNAALAPLGQWTCVEYRLTAESVGGAHDGTYEAWVNDVQVASYPNASWNGPTGQSQPWWTDFLISAYWNCQCDPTRYQCNNNATACIDPQNAHPAMTRLVDRIVISKARIGCGTLPQPMAPGPPVGLNVSWLVPFLAAAGGMALVLRRG